MANLSTEYLKTVIPDGMKKGADLLKEGAELGKDIEVGETKFFASRGFKGFTDYSESEEGKKYIQYGVNIGFATAETTIESCIDLSKWGRTIGVQPCGYVLSSMQIGVPKELRDPDLDTTSFMLETQEDYNMFNVEDVYAPIANFVTVCPNALETTKFALRAGLPALGTCCQIMWSYPNCDDDVQEVEDIVRALGIVVSKGDIGASMTSYVDDGLAGCCSDTVSYVAAYLFDQYAFGELCGIEIDVGFGGLVSDIKTRAALIKALSDLAHEKGCRLAFVHGNTTSHWDHDVESNYGMICQEMLMTLLAKERYDLKCQVLAVPVTEAITVPTLDEIKGVIAASSRVREAVPLWRDLINWDEIEEMAEVLKREGKKMFQNILTTFEETGFDITDPVPLLKFMKSVDPSLFEQAFHPSVWETGVFKAWYPNDMGKMTVDAIDKNVARLKAEGYDENSLKGKRIVVGSTDIHTYGAAYAMALLQNFGAEVVNVGIDNSARSMIDAATEEGIDTILVSTHSGNAYGIANGFESIMKKEKLNYKVSMGGILTSILDGHAEPTNVADLINQRGFIKATNDMSETFKMICE